jgi:hypothetical protein
MSRGRLGRRISTNPETTQGGLDTRVITDAIRTGVATERAVMPPAGVLGSAMASQTGTR